MGNSAKHRNPSQFMQDKNINLSAKTYFIDAMGAMAFGLFASLLIGTICSTLGDKLHIELLTTMASYAKQATGAALGLAVAYTLKAPPLVLYTCAAVGIAGNDLGGPVGAYVAVVLACEIGKLISKETKLDIILTPAVTLTVGTAAAIWIGPKIQWVMDSFGDLIMSATEMRPLLMGIIVSVLVGIALTLPISSAAICIMLGLSGIAAGAATAGCCAQMVGFAVMSYGDNGWGGLLAQGLGTSMLQMPNIIKKPWIWIPPIAASAATGALSTTVFRLENSPVGAGMGTCGLVGPLGIMTEMTDNTPMKWIGIVLICFILPGVFTWAVYAPMKKMGLINDGDLTLDKGI